MPAGTRPRHPFRYPKKPHVRRHTPPAFRSHHSFKDCLRDEFIFRCVYCLSRETWYPNDAAFGVDHYRPKSRYAIGKVAYPNLLYACNRCNSAKGSQELPLSLFPETNPYYKHLWIEPHGTIRARTAEGSLLINVLRLDLEDMNRWRRKYYAMLKEALRKKHHPIARECLRDFFGFPASMPALGRWAINPYAFRSGLPPWY